MTSDMPTRTGNGVHERDDGQAVLTGPALKLFDHIDELVKRWAATEGAEDYLFPVTLRGGDAYRMGYVESFPHLLTFPVAIDGTEENVRRFTARQTESGQFSLTDVRTRTPKHVLSHAACSHFYPLFGNSDVDGPRLLTTRSTCFRSEAQFVSLQRQRCFTMREVVCIGTAADTDKFLDHWHTRVDTLAKTLGLPMTIENATDPFFGDSENTKYIMQKVDPVKFEMMYADELAIGSLNNHRDYFGLRYDIRTAGETAHTACVAFGLERWIYAILDHAGPHASNWPDLRGLD